MELQDHPEASAALDVASPFVLPDWLADASESERAELQHLIGIPVRDAADAELAASASQFIAAIYSQSVELERYAEAERAEIARIQSRYDAVKSKLATRIQSLETQLTIVAEGLEYGKKKTRVLGNGTVGFRTLPERVSVVDSVALVTWASAHAPDLVRKEIKLSVPQSAVKEHLKATGELAEGCTIIPESQKMVYTAEVG